MNRFPYEKTRSVLLIRRDNIGDLICTTPAIHAVRKQFPYARIGIFVNSYNADVVANNPDIDAVYIYKKAKHAFHKRRSSVWYSNIKILRNIRRERYDIAIGCSYAYARRVARYTFLTGAKKRVGYSSPRKSFLFYNLPIIEPLEPVHEVVATYRLLEPLGITGEPPGLVLRPNEAEVFKVDAFFASRGIDPEKLVAVHISSRRPENRWPKERFAELADILVREHGMSVMILWSPGAVDNPFHPGDDEAAKWVEENSSSNILLFPTMTLSSLIAAIDMSRMVICLDGGAMHIAAALKKPIVTIWGSTDRRRWSPWGVESIILQKGKRAEEIMVQDVLSAFCRFWKD